jgi:hypothetical protein
MKRRLLVALLLATCCLLAGCDGSFDSIVGPKATPTPTPAARPTPKPGDWMWDKKRANPLSQTPTPR